MNEGLRMLGQGRTALAEATEKRDLSRMERTASEMQAGVARYESELAALTALKGGKGPQEIALSWFRSEMNLDPSLELESNTMVMGMSPFHLIICAMMTLFGAGSVWIYFLRMQRVATFIQHLSQPTTSSSVAPQADVFPLATSLTQQDTHEQTIEELTRKVFDRRSLVHFLSFGEGWLSLITGSDFSRSNIVKSFLREKFRTEASADENAFMKKEIQDTLVSASDAQQS